MKHSSTVYLHCNENPIYVFLCWELRCLRPNFHIHVSVSDLCVPRMRILLAPILFFKTANNWKYWVKVEFVLAYTEYTRNQVKLILSIWADCIFRILKIFCGLHKTHRLLLASLLLLAALMLLISLMLLVSLVSPVAGTLLLQTSVIFGFFYCRRPCCCQAFAAVGVPGELLLFSSLLLIVSFFCWYWW